MASVQSCFQKSSKAPTQFLENQNNGNNSKVWQRWCNISAVFCQNIFFQLIFGQKPFTLLIMRIKNCIFSSLPLQQKWSHLKHFLGIKTLFFYGILIIKRLLTRQTLYTFQLLGFCCKMLRKTINRKNWRQRHRKTSRRQRYRDTAIQVIKGFSTSLPKFMDKTSKKVVRIAEARTR